MRNAAPAREDKSEGGRGARRWILPVIVLLVIALAVFSLIGGLNVLPAIYSLVP